MVTARAPGYRYLRGDRNRHLLPHRQLVPLRDFLAALAESTRAIATQVEGDTPHLWTEAADAIDAAVAALNRVAR